MCRVVRIKELILIELSEFAGRTSLVPKLHTVGLIDLRDAALDAHVTYIDPCQFLVLSAECLGAFRTKNQALGTKNCPKTSLDRPNPGRCNSARFTAVFATCTLLGIAAHRWRL